MIASLFCETPSSWGDRQNALYSTFAKGSRILNMMLTFVLHPLSHYNTITEPRARFLLSFIEDLSINFPSHFILSLIDFYKDTMTHDKLIFPSIITRLLHHFSVFYLESSHFLYMCVIDAATVQRSTAQLRPRQPQTHTVAPTTSISPSTFTPTSLAGGVTLETIMAQLVRMDARLDTLNEELCQVNTHVGHIARRQAVMSGFTVVSSPSLEASKDESEDGSDSADDAEDDDDGSPSDDEMST